jgi:hypothetical protein
MISVVIFSAVILGLAGLSFQVAKRSTRATDQALMMSILLSRMDRATTIEFDSLGTLVGCDTTISGVVQLIGCTDVQSVTPRVSTVRIVASTSVAGSRPDTITFQRGKERRPVPLK